MENRKHTHRTFGWRRRSDKLVLGLALLAVFGLFFTYTQACSQSGGVSGPSDVGGQSSASVAAAPAQVPATPADPATSLDIKVRNNGEVINNTGETLTACLFDKPYGEGALVDEWKAKPGVTQSDYKAPFCASSTGQIEVTDRGSCPQIPHGFIGLAANPNVTIPGTEDLCCVAPEEVTLTCWDVGLITYCKATASVPSNFEWEPEYKAELEESHDKETCQTKTYESFWTYVKDGRHWQDLDYVTVRAFNCECPESGTSAVWERDEKQPD